ncbi:MAG: 3-phosphoshikimate 1-carboxyvinyltransferase [Candidatus Delongbacteria bacterium]|nr:3-phosphoshikimate 1-carboxyvinyltransferase [Candidatus Delongbacteria bacterium]MCG2761224.1 3-phosphoshikimate 1-carboxyvinyltransferase [Candidatus Delongbacteria bacterium]
MGDSLFISKGSVCGEISAYPSKSYIQRALALGLLNKNVTVITNYTECEDSKAVLRSIIDLGAKVERSGNNLKIIGAEKFNHAQINCNESGLCLRMFAPILSLSKEEFKIYGSKRLLERNNEHVCNILSRLGAKCYLERDYLSVRGPLKCGEVIIKNPTGSQLITGLLFALSKANGDSKIIIENPVSFPYIRMTAELLNRFGAEININEENEIFIKGNSEFIEGTIDIEGDWSSAAFFFVAAAIAGEVKIRNLNPNSLQADSAILKYLNKSGAKVIAGNDEIKVVQSELNGFTADIKDHPDLFIPLVILAVNCKGISKIYNYERLKYKESDRPSAIISELRKAGAKISVEDGFVKIEKSEISYGKPDIYNDHRLAMGFAVAAINSKFGLKIKNYQCVNKSYPSFFEELKSITREN